MELIALDKLQNGAGQLKTLGWSREKIVEQVNVCFGLLEDMNVPTVKVEDPTVLKPTAPSPDYSTSS